MKQSIFKTVPLAKRSFFQKIFSQHPEENAVIELNNLLASKVISDIQKHEIYAIQLKYKISLQKEFKLNLEEFYAVYLNHCLKDKTIDAGELRELTKLKDILQLESKSIDNLHIMIGQIIYKQSFEQAVSDGQLTTQEKAFLTKLEADLRLPRHIADKISDETRTAFIQNYAAKIISDERLSPDEEQELHAIAKNLNVPLEFDENTKVQLQQLKLYWALENLDLPAVQPGIALQKNEQCYLVVPNAAWNELRSVRKGVSYSGYSTSFRVAKGFYLRSGYHKPTTYSTEQMRKIDTGTLYLTNKRIIFTGNLKNSNIRHDKILSITPYTDGVEIGKKLARALYLFLKAEQTSFASS